MLLRTSARLRRWTVVAMLGCAWVVTPAYAQTGSDAAYLARVRSPGGAVTTPSLATIASSISLGPGFHLQVGFGAEALTGVAYSVAADLPILAATNAAHIRMGLSAGMVEGVCPEGLLDQQRSCTVGHIYGVNVIGRIARHQFDSTAARRTLFVGWAADLGYGDVKSRGSTVGYGDVESRTATIGLAIPMMLSFRTSRRTSATESDPRFNPHTTVFVEPGFSIGRASGGEPAFGILPQLSAGVSILDIGPGFGISGTARKWSGMNRLRGALAISWHARR